MRSRRTSSTCFWNGARRPASSCASSATARAWRTDGSARRYCSPRSRSQPMSPERALAEVAKLAARSVTQVADGLEAEQWASDLFQTLQPPDPMLILDFIAALEILGTAPALAALRALSAVGPRETVRVARITADRLAAAEVPEPAWGNDVGRSRPVAAALLE